MVAQNRHRGVTATSLDLPQRGSHTRTEVNGRGQKSRAVGMGAHPKSELLTDSDGRRLQYRGMCCGQPDGEGRNQDQGHEH